MPLRELILVEGSAKLPGEKKTSPPEVSFDSCSEVI